VRVCVCELPDELWPHDSAWTRFAQHVEEARPDIALLNEMPFGPWVARERIFDSALAHASVRAHELALLALVALPCAVIASRPVDNNGRLANEAFLLSSGIYAGLHHKHYFPEEHGFFENTWFAPGRPGFDIVEHHGVRFGALLCTELMFTEWARHYRRQGAHVIVSPRASCTSMRNWDAAARMAAIASGCYVLSSNRVSNAAGAEPRFGGKGFAYSPTGELLCETSDAEPVALVDIDLGQVAEAQRQYPCYVRELA
jgi:N-carbamoylputrescine amidase